MNTTTANQPTGSQTGPQPLSRPTHDRMLAGVAAGVARYLDLDVTIVRVVFAVLAVVGGVGVPLYLIGWLLMPEDGSGQSIASHYLQNRPRSR